MAQVSIDLRPLALVTWADAGIRDEARALHSPAFRADIQPFRG
jgi:hypothetical protein